MKAIKIKNLGYIIFTIGLSVSLAPNLGVTGAIIGGGKILGLDLFYIGLFLMALSLVLLTRAVLEERVVMPGVKLKSHEERLTVPDEYVPVILDTNYLIDSSEKDQNRYIKDKVIESKRGYHDIIIPREVLREFIPARGKSQSIKDRSKDLRKFLEKETNPLEEIRKRGKDPRSGKMKRNYSGKRKMKYEKIAKEILEKTPKAIACEFLRKMDSEGTYNIDDFLDAYNLQEVPFSREEVAKALDKGFREYTKAKDTRDFLRRYSVTQGDISVLANALYLQNVSDIVGDTPVNRVKIVSRDEHLIQAQRIINERFKKRSGKIIVSDKL